mmetsp:Transcript_55712/g.130616  ORF Transcript_55712/g.130616 Transcript_55712/m.130616 type:complete len:218 (-) Transcript_55712:195-848(-)
MDTFCARASRSGAPAARVSVSSPSLFCNSSSTCFTTTWSKVPRAAGSLSSADGSDVSSAVSKPSARPSLVISWMALDLELASTVPSLHGTKTDVITVSSFSFFVSAWTSFVSPAFCSCSAVLWAFSAALSSSAATSASFLVVSMTAAFSSTAFLVSSTAASRVVFSASPDEIFSSAPEILDSRSAWTDASTSAVMATVRAWNSCLSSFVSPKHRGRL